MLRYTTFMLKNKKLIEIGYGKEINFESMEDDKKKMILNQVNQKTVEMDSLFGNIKDV